LRTLANANLIIMLPMEIRCRGLLFDMDGVLVDSTPAVARVWAAWAGKYGFEPADVVRRAHGRPSIATIRELLPLGDHHAEDRAIEKAEIGDVEDIVALPGATELLSALSPDRFAVVTSATRPLAIVRIRAAGFAIPKHLVTASDIHRGKPDPEPYLRGAQALGIPPADCVVVEDAPAGIQSGKAAGARVLALRTTAEDPDLLRAGADWIVTDCSAISLQPLRGDQEIVLVLPDQR
jgi:mannitol-1-/sugar-/sorbitol-6-phosphatase